MERQSESSESDPVTSVSNFKRWARRTVVAILGITISVYLVLLIVFQTSKRIWINNLSAASEVFQSEMGPIEFATSGQGNAVLVLHGTPAGYDQGVLISKMLGGDRFHCVSPSRPGYLRTSISVGRSPADQADAFALLLDNLGMDQVAVIGVSGGGPSAIEFAKRHPKRLSCLVLIAAIAQPWRPQGFDPYESSLVQTIDRFFGDGFSHWLLCTYVTWFPKHAIENSDDDFLNNETKRRLLEDPVKLGQLVDVMWTGFPPGRWDGLVNDRNQYQQLDLGSVEQIQHPTLIVHGTEDATVSIDGARAIASRLENAETLWVDGGEHFVFVTHREDIWPQVAEFIESSLSLREITRQQRNTSLRTITWW